MLASPNVLTTWGRAVYDPTDGSTLPSVATYVDLPSHVDVIPSTAFHELPTNARTSTYVFLVDPGTDIVTGDILLSASDLLSGVNWPNDYPSDPSDPGYGGTVWQVRFHEESSAGPGAYRALYISKVQTSGPASPY